ncbi:MAG: DUF402 domain-containing protein [Crenarchaeota archaeon]|nr:DUF402 domain-containing protein [Thermoproteota archaeon]
MSYKVRIRGIYATALSKLLLDRGFTIVQPSQVIVDRFRIDNPSYEPPDVTIKDSDNVKGGLVLIGKCDAVEKILEVFLDISDEIFIWRCKIPLHRVVRGVVKKVEENRVIVDLGGVEGILPTLSAPLYREGDVIPVTVVKTALRDDEDVILSNELRVDGKYVSIVPGGRVIMSKHIRDPEKRSELYALGMMYLNKLGGYGIKWRSSAQYAEYGELMKEIEELSHKLDEMRERAWSCEPYAVLQEGECVCEIVPSYSFRRAMDDVRNMVTPTIINHHSLKMFMRKTTIIDYTEHVLSYVTHERCKISRALIDFIFSRRYRVIIRHAKPDGSLIKIGPAVLVRYGDDIILARRLRSGGVLDGLGVPKEDGDFAVTWARFESWYLAHAYFSKEKRLKGVYVNVNTPIEPVKDGIYYVDLYVDVVKRSDENEPRIIDVEEFERLKSCNIIRESMYEKVRRVVEEVVSRFDEISSKCVEACDEAASALGL